MRAGDAGTSGIAKADFSWVGVSLGRRDSVEPVLFLRKESREDVCESLVNSACRSATWRESSRSLEIQMGRLSFRKTKLCRASMVGVKT